MGQERGKVTLQPLAAQRGHEHDVGLGGGKQSRGGGESEVAEGAGCESVDEKPEILMTLQYLVYWQTCANSKPIRVGGGGSPA